MTDDGSDLAALAAQLQADTSGLLDALGIVVPERMCGHCGRDITDRAPDVRYCTREGVVALGWIGQAWAW